MEGNVKLGVDEYNRLTKIERDMELLYEGKSYPVQIVNHFFYSRSYYLSVENNQSRIMTKDELKAATKSADTSLRHTIEMSLSKIAALNEKREELKEELERIKCVVEHTYKQVENFKGSSLFKRLVTALFNRI